MSGYAPAVLDELIKRALRERASDIHIEPSLEIYIIRFRVDGFLLHDTQLELLVGSHVIARIKVLAQLNVAERRIPQDGKFSVTLPDETCDIRVAIFPCIYGEKVVLRLLHRDQGSLSLDELGLSPEMHTSLVELSRRSSGFLLATGPTGSGKTTLLHAVLSQIKSVHTNIMTLEDPVEYTIPGITQTAINPDIGLTFELGLRSLLRLDPDVIMVGEIRDIETAQVALKAALTGHFVLSTLHTIDAPSALLRLLAMGIQPFLVNATVSGIVAQRLARRLCNACKQPKKLSSSDQQIASKFNLSISSSYESVGCHECKETGTCGRIGIFQLLLPSPFLRSLLHPHADYATITLQANKEGMRSLLTDGASKINNGLISFNELFRICF
ncbi:type II/IV secretion system protein [Candidatus Dependentiae bacterium]|nr:type II/IV secretion system protein [Candidatus Dependentiae bacterium]